jgi:hypothetical protein
LYKPNFEGFRSETGSGSLCSTTISTTKPCTTSLRLQQGLSRRAPPRADVPLPCNSRRGSWNCFPCIQATLSLIVER